MLLDCIHISTESYNRQTHWKHQQIAEFSQLVYFRREKWFQARIKLHLFWMNPGILPDPTEKSNIITFMTQPDFGSRLTVGSGFTSFICIPPIGITVSSNGPPLLTIGFELMSASAARFSNWLIDGKFWPKRLAIITSNCFRITYSRPLEIHITNIYMNQKLLNWKLRNKKLTNIVLNDTKSWCISAKTSYSRCKGEQYVEYKHSIDDLRWHSLKTVNSNME